MRAVRVLIAITAMLVAPCSKSHPLKPAIDGRIHAVASTEISKVIAVAQQQPYVLAEPIYRVHIVSRNEVQVYYGAPPKHYKDIERYRLVERIRGNWQVTHTMVIGRNDPVE